MSNFLEELAAEFYEYNGCFVRRNIRVNKREKGGHASELDVVAYDPKRNIIHHIEPTMDADSWDKRESRYEKKFAEGKKAFPEMFPSNIFNKETTIEQIILLGFGSNVNHEKLAGGEVVPVKDFLNKIVNSLKGKDIYRDAVPENYPLLRMIQFMISTGLVK